MAKDFDSFCRSSLGAFVRSTLGARGCDTECPAVSTGGCCIADPTIGWHGQCVDNLTEEQCARVGGSYSGDNASCVQSDCWETPELPDSDSGECCYRIVIGYPPDPAVWYRCFTTWQGADFCNHRMDGECDPGGITYPICYTVGGFTPHYKCHNDPATSCAHPQGICCHPDGGGFWANDKVCRDSGGTPIGPLASSEHCDDMVPCCYPDANGILQCEIQWPTNCYWLSGTPMFDATSCQSDTCGVGACCLRCTGCVDNIREGVCRQLGGDYQGHGETCPQAACPDIPGACCDGYGACIPDLTEPLCAQRGGIYQGDNTHCVDIVCPLGACCLADGTCLDGISDGECVILRGRYRPAPTTCNTTSCRGACCQQDGSCADGLTHGDCDFVLSFDKQCSQTECQGACCIGEFCLDAHTVADCNNIGGIFMDVGTKCEDVDCESLGVCCATDGDCRDDWSASLCGKVGGTWMPGVRRCDQLPGEFPCRGACCGYTGDCTPNSSQAGCSTNFMGFGTLCFSGLCDVTHGACCRVDGSCVLTSSPEACHAQDGIFRGIGVPCEAATCETTIGACCYVGDCIMVDGPDACLGAYLGMGSSCAGINCGEGDGACCVSQRCHDSTTYEQCRIAGGAYAGEGSTCDSWKGCTPGACCFSGQPCRNMTEDGCVDSGGVWYGSYGAFFVECEDGPCP